MRTSPRKFLIRLERATVTKNDHNDAVKTWSLLAPAYAQVSFGTGQERRAAAQEQASQTATFRVLANPITRTLSPVTDRVADFLGSNWDITSVTPLDRDGVEFVAIRKVGSAE